MNKLKQFFCVAILIVIYVYVCNITLLPSSIIIFEGEELNLKTVAGLKIRRANNANVPVIQASSLADSEQSSKYETAGTFELNLNLFGTIPVKEICKIDLFNFIILFFMICYDIYFFSKAK